MIIIDGCELINNLQSQLYSLDMSKDEVIVRFNKASFEYGHNKPILNEADFSVRRGSKIALMGQNGAGKSTIFQLITQALKPTSGDVHLGQELTIAISRQVIPRGQLDLTVREFFASYATSYAQ